MITIEKKENRQIFPKTGLDINIDLERGIKKTKTFQKTGLILIRRFAVHYPGNILQLT